MDDLVMVTSRSLGDTLCYDAMSRRWFEGLLSSTRVVERLVVANGSTRLVLRRAVFLRRVALGLQGVAAVFFLSAWFGVGDEFWSWMLAGAIFFLLAEGAFWLGWPGLRQLAARWVESEPSGAVAPGVTFYQAAELWSREYGVASLVDIITRRDQCLRYAVLMLFVLVFLLYQMPFLAGVAVMLSGLFLLRIGDTHF